jgi:hypothetical protein
MLAVYAIWETAKAGMETLPVNIDQLFVDVFYFFFIAASESMFSSEPTTTDG